MQEFSKIKKTMSCSHKFERKDQVIKIVSVLILDNDLSVMCLKCIDDFMKFERQIRLMLHVHMAR